MLTKPIIVNAETLTPPHAKISSVELLSDSLVPVTTGGGSLERRLLLRKIHIGIYFDKNRKIHKSDENGLVV